MPPQPYLIENKWKILFKVSANGERRHTPVIIVGYLHDELVRYIRLSTETGEHAVFDEPYLYCMVIPPKVTLKGDNDKKLQYYKVLEKSHTEHERMIFISWRNL